MKMRRANGGVAQIFTFELVSCVLSLVLLFASAQRGWAETAKSADAFVDSVGVNIHLHYTDTAYGNFTSVEQALKALGVRHVRDGLIDSREMSYYDRHNELGRAGIKGLFITSEGQTAQLLSDYPRRMHDSFEAYEAPNEFDAKRSPTWAARLNVFMPLLANAVKSDATTSRFPIVGPSLTRAESFPHTVDAVQYFDFANLHNYFGGHHPGTHGWGNNGYGSYEWNLRLAKLAWPQKPVMTTETGYVTDPQNQQAVPEEVAGKYIPRLLLEQWLHNISRTYIYELLDLPPGRSVADGSFGLLHHDFSPKPAYSAVRSLLQLLADPGPAFPLHDFDTTLAGDLTDVQHVLLEKRDGTFYLIVWVEQSDYDVNQKRVLPVPAHPLTIQNRRHSRVVLRHMDAQGILHPSAPSTAEAQSFSAGDAITVVEFKLAHR